MTTPPAPDSNSPDSAQSAATAQDQAPLSPERHGARIEGLDVARALAIFGMFAAHVGDAVSESGWSWLSVTHGRPSALFAILAGVSITLMLTRKAGVPGNCADAADVTFTRWRVAIRGLILLPMGYLLSELGTPVVVILANLGVLFLLSLAFFRWPQWGLWTGAAVFMVVGQALAREVAPLAQSAGIYDAPAVEMLWGEHYTVLSWMGYLLAGMALGRLALQSRRTQVVMAASGALGLVLTTVVGVVAGGSAETAFSPWLSTIDHSYTPLEMFSNLSSACLVMGLCLIIAQIARAAVWPLIAAGSMALTLYVAHLIVIAAVGKEMVWEATNVAYVALCLSAIAFACLWRWKLGQGPLERLMSVASTKGAAAITYRSQED